MEASQWTVMRISRAMEGLEGLEGLEGQEDTGVKEDQEENMEAERKGNMEEANMDLSMVNWILEVIPRM